MAGRTTTGARSAALIPASFLALCLAAGAQTAPEADEPAATEASDRSAVVDAVTEARTLANAGRAAEGVALLDALIADLESTADSVALVAPLLVLADLQLAAGDAGAAIIAYERAIPIIEQIDGPFSPALVDPLAGMALALQRAKRHEDAITLLRRARHITHRNDGIMNMDQLELADHLAESYIRLGMIGEANRENRFAFRVNENEYGPDSPELVPAINKLAAWYERIGAFSVARQYYRRSVELLEQAYGENDLRLAEPLRHLARSYLKENKAMREAELSLLRVLEIYDANPEVDVVDHANSLVELGDWFLVARRREKAMEMYRTAWDLMTENGAEPERADPVFGRPTRLRLAVPTADESMFAGRDELHVDVRFSVTPLGSVRDVKIIGGNAHWSLKRAFRTAMNKARYRPRFADGEPAPTESVVLRYSWQRRGNQVRASVDRSGDKEIP